MRPSLAGRTSLSIRTDGPSMGVPNAAALSAADFLQNFHHDADSLETLTQMKRILLLLTLAASTLYAESPPPPGKTTPLFDGKTLGGWEGNPKLWRVED